MEFDVETRRRWETVSISLSGTCVSGKAKYTSVHLCGMILSDACNQSAFPQSECLLVFLACTFITRMSIVICTYMECKPMCLYAWVVSNSKSINKDRREKVRVSKWRGRGNEKTSERNSRIEWKKNRLKAGNWLTCFKHCISALRSCSSH